MDYTCRDCLYANFNEDGSVLCDKTVLITGELYYLEKDKVDLPCVAHSSKYIEEIRYMRNNQWLHDSEEGEYCQVCRRKINLEDISHYGFIPVQNESGKTTGEKMQCKICRSKGRGKY